MTPKELRALAADKALDIGTAWNALEAAAERIETLEEDCASLKQRAWRNDAEFLAEQIEAIATLMWALAERMEYFGGFNGEMVKHSREMAGASVIARKWAGAIRHTPNVKVDAPSGATAEPCNGESGCSQERTHG